MLKRSSALRIIAVIIIYVYYYYLSKIIAFYIAGFISLALHWMQSNYMATLNSRQLKDIKF